MKYRNLFFIFIIAIFLIVSGCATTTPLIKASERGDSLAVQKLLNEGANINEPDSSGYTPLVYAIWSGKTETVKVLINKGADINKRDKTGYTPLLWASKYGYLDIAKLLIDGGADINAKDKNGSTPLMLASSGGYLDIAKLLIDKGADVNAQDKTGLTALHNIAQSYSDNNTVMLIEYLLSKNASINVKDVNGWTPLRYAINLQNIDMAATLRKKTNWEEEIKDLSFDEALRSPSTYKPEQNMFDVPTGKERAYKMAITDCNLMTITGKYGLLITTGPLGYVAGLAYDAATVPKKFQNCMEKMGFECKNNCSK
jgi:ankyrin repeat protein